MPLGDIRIEYLPVVDSTNRLLKDRARAGAPFGTVVIADRQTHGRGRLGRSFASPGNGLYMSVWLEPIAEPMRLTALGAVAVARAIDGMTAADTRIKWVNDVYLREKKVTGILAEGVWSGETMLGAVLGIGVNIAPAEGGFPKELRAIAGTLFERAPENVLSMRDQLARSILRALSDVLARPFDRAWLDAYRAKSLLDNRTITVVDGDTEYPARALGIAEDFGLRVCVGNEERCLRAGEVRIRL